MFNHRLIRGVLREREHLMSTARDDPRSPQRRAQDEQIASEPHLEPPQIPSDAVPLPMEAHLGRLGKQPVADAGVVENGLVRPLDPAVKLTESVRGFRA
jgi:hypothetical protein